MSVEKALWQLDKLNSVAVIEAAMAHEGRRRADLARIVGQSRATEILQRKRPLTLPMIRKIAAAWNVPERSWCAITSPWPPAARSAQQALLETEQALRRQEPRSLTAHKKNPIDLQI